VNLKFAKSEPLGVVDRPINPLKLALACNATFIARANGRDIEHMVEVFTKAINHKGFSFVEIMQDCIVFNLEINKKDERMYKILDNVDLGVHSKEFERLIDQGVLPSDLYKK